MSQVAGLQGSFKKYYEKSKTAIVERDNRPLWHILAVIAIMLLGLLLFYKSFTDQGMLIHQDMTFPTTLSRNVTQYVNMWWEYGSAQNIFTIQRIFWSFPLLFVAQGLRLSNSTYLFLMFWTTFCLAGISMYALTYHFLRKLKPSSSAKYAIYFGCVLAGVIYMYNPWALNHFWPYFAFPPYALAPLIFLLALKTFDSPTFGKIFALAILLTLASTGPLCVVWVWLLVLSYGLYYLVINRFRRKSLATTAKILVSSAIIYVFVNATWLLPYARSQISGQPFLPSYSGNMTQGILDGLSANNTIVNNLRLISGWGLPVKPPIDNSLWVFLSFALPVIAIAAFLVFRKSLAKDRIINYWSIMFLASILLATGSSFVLRGVYSYFSLNASFGWIIRAPDRWLFYVPVFYCLMTGLLITRLLEYRTSPASFAPDEQKEVAGSDG